RGRGCRGGEVVAEVVGQQDGRRLGRRDRGRRVPGTRRGRGADGVDAELLGQLVPGIRLRCHVWTLPTEENHGRGEPVQEVAAAYGAELTGAEEARERRPVER